MNPIPNAAKALTLLCALASAEIADTVHPDFELRAIAMPARYKTMGMAFLPDGSLALGTTEAIGGGEIPEPSEDHKLLLLRGMSPDTLPGLFRELAHGWRQIAGVLAVGNQLYVSDRDGFYAIESLEAPENPKANRKLLVKWPDAGHWNFGPSWHQWVFTPLYKDGRFYAPYSGSILTGGWSNADATSPLSGAFLQWDAQGTLSAYAGGLRSPNGAALDPATGEMFVTDNQGSWEPTSTFLRMRPGRFYGHRQTAQDLDDSGIVVNTRGPNFAEGLPYDPPVAWLPHGTLRSSPSQPARIPAGPFAGDYAIGDVNNPGLVRVYLDRVGEEINGAAFWFTKGTGYAAINRMVPGPDGALWIGTVTTIGGNWPAGERRPLFRLAPKADPKAFDLRAVRAMDGGLELEFTRPCDPAAAAPGNFTVKSWQYLRQKEYGLGKQAEERRTVVSAEASKDGRRIFLAIPGLQTDRLLHVKLAGVGGADGGALWNDEAWFTLNALSPRPWRPEASASLAAPAIPPARVSLLRRPGGLSVSLAGCPAGIPWTAEIFSAAGARLGKAPGRGPAAAFLAAPAAGMAWVRVSAPALGNLQVTIPAVP